MMSDVLWPTEWNLQRAEARIAELEAQLDASRADVEDVKAHAEQLADSFHNARSKLAALWALVEKKDKALEAVLGAWLGSATPQEFWEKFSDENEGDDLWGDVAVACALTALTEEDILGRLGIYINED